MAVCSGGLGPGHSGLGRKGQNYYSGGLILSGHTGLGAVESYRSLTEEPSGHVGGVDWDSPVSHLASAALTVWHLQWLLCTFRAWITGVGGSLRSADGAFSPEACSASAPVSAC